MAEVALEHVHKFYDGQRVHAVNDLTMKVQNGESLALLGPSGCGKTSTLRMVAGLEAISSGRIYIAGRVVNDLAPAQRNIAMAFENFGLYPHFSAYANIAYPLKLRGRAESDIEKKVRQVASLLGIEDILDKRPRELGGAHQQRVSLARALVRDPDVFLLDEPISHLDAALRARMRAELKRLHRDLGATMVYVTHDQLEAMSMADRIAIMNNGKLQQVGTPSEIYNHPANMFVADFVGQPPINFLSCYIVSGAGSLYVSVLGEIRLPVPEQYRQPLLKKQWEELVLGIRPHEVTVALGGEDARGLRGTVYIVEPLGEYSVLTVRVGQRTVRALADPSFAAARDAPVTLLLNARGMLLFDEETGEELSYLN